jgi:antitoxin component YwqK of YwqJK toxin-antitoxin module
MSAGSPLYDNGLPRFKGDYLDGKMHGYWEFYRKDGSLMRSGAFDREVQVGVWKTFDRAGALVKETKFRNPQ